MFRLQPSRLASCVLLAVAACTQSLGGSPQGVVSQASTSCVRCHGTFDNAAPPNAVNGSMVTTYVGVGAHQTHVRPGPFRKAVACDECHVVPATSEDPGHVDKDRADVRFGGLAMAGGASPAWNRASASCSATYCHGATLGGGSNTAPVWTKVDGSQVACGTCHGIPPPTSSGHPQGSSDTKTCGACHAGTVNADGTIDVAGGQHIDGTVQLGGLACASCHGDPTRLPAAIAPAPPRDAQGKQASSAPGVGAHQGHLVAGVLRPPMACTECHSVPTSLAGHPDGALDITWGALAKANGTVPAFDAASATCASTYCHGGTLKGGTLTRPTWTTVDGSQTRCGTCHGVPPPAPHPQNATCAACHDGYTSTSVNLAIHVDGNVQSAGLSCTTCHGDASRPAAIQAAPPLDTKGGTSTASLGVGAHQQHLVAGLLRPAMACAECHPVPTNVNHSNARIEMSWGSLARSGGSTPTWNRTAATCANYCHGATLSGGTVASPVWTTVNGSQTRCGTCHGIPPAEPHVQRMDCGSCHAGYDSQKVNLALHVNGVLDTGSLTCSTCHGDRTRLPAGIASAPPADTTGASSTTARRVGAHLKHLTDGVLRKAIGCAECHKVPTDPRHADGTLDLTWGTLARTGGTAPAYDPGTGTCSASYCHGSTLAGGSNTRPLWTKVDGSQARCGTCHGIPPPAPHVQSTNCGGCHAGYTSTAVNVASHVNGSVEASSGCTACHGDAARPAAIQAAPPADTRSNTSTTARGVGAHQQHLVDGATSRAFACGECHTVPANLTSHPSGTIDMTWGPLARSGGAIPSFDGATCANYCHGATLAGGTTPRPIWTRVDGTQAACGACHGIPPPAPHVQNTACAGCHAGYTSSTVNLAVHVNGTVEASGTSCTSCHGDAGRPAAIQAAPPKDSKGNSATTALGVGAHQAHLAGGALRPAMACTECHAVPANMTSHPDGAVNMTWGPLARSGGAAATFDAPSATCTNYCHGGTLTAGGTDTTPVWTRVDGTQAACGTCHGVPPPAPHVQNTSCGGCHAGYSATTVNLATHVDGTLQATEMTCSSCHGDPGRVLVNYADPQTAAAPPVDTHGGSDPATRPVGAHLAHLNKGTGAIARPTACDECHLVPSSNAHSNGTVAVTFGALGKTGGSSPAWNGATCSASYCHGSTLGSGTNHAPSWTGGASQSACGTCHGNPPATRRHGDHRGSKCSDCHGTGYVPIDLARHVNGLREVGNKVTSWNASTRQCSSTCHGTQTW